MGEASDGSCLRRHQIGYARAQIEDQQEFIKDNSERYSRRTAAREEKQQARSAEFRAIMEALQREQVQAASEADKAADLAKMGMR